MGKNVDEKSMPIPLIGRLAPSPTGALHLGNVRTFMIAWLRVRSCGGKIILRNEDLDHPRHQAGADAAIVEDLKWLGFDWDEGPDIGGPSAPYDQSSRTPIYRAALDRLLERGLVYPCVCSRKDCEEGQSAPHLADGIHYSGRCRGRFASYAEAAATLEAPRLPAWRFKVPENTMVDFTDVFAGPQHQNVSEQTGDFVLARDPDGAGYMLAVVVDDAAMGVTEVVRGDDLLPATGRQLLLFQALGLTPPAFLHVPMVIGPEGLRLAKRHGDTRIRACREAGISPETILGVLAWWSGWAAWGEKLSLRDLLTRFDLAKLPHERIVLTDEVKRFLKIKD